MTLHKNFISGAWIDGTSVNRNINPSDLSEVVGEYARASRAQAEEAIAAARAAVPKARALTPQQRFDALDFIGTEILARKDDLGALLSREEGKTLPEGIGEATRAGQVFKFFAGEALRLTGDSIASTRPGLDVEVLREPAGVIGLVTPWNFPIAIPAWKIAPALAYGNCVVFKPADLVPGSAWALAEIISRSGLPEGVFNLVMGSGREIGDTIVNSPYVDAVSFTGSVDVGRDIAGKCVTRGAKVQMEMGGKNPLVVLDDADLDNAINVALQGAFFSTGQRCTASSRLIVTKGIHDRFVEGLVAKMKALTVGHAMEKGTDIGPVVSASQLEQDLSYVSIASAEGGQVAWGGERLNRATEGFYMQPCLLVGTRNDQRINREEVFGPVASVIEVADYEEAAAVANDTIFGLSSGICTSSLKYSRDFKHRSTAGMVMVNVPTAGVDYHVPFGGRKGSSYGSREQGSYAREFYTTVKTAYTLAM